MSRKSMHVSTAFSPLEGISLEYDSLIMAERPRDEDSIRCTFCNSTTGLLGAMLILHRDLYLIVDDEWYKQRQHLLREEA